MDKLVNGTANLNLRENIQNTIEYQDENCTPNCMTMSSPSSLLPLPLENGAQLQEQLFESLQTASTASYTADQQTLCENHNCWEEIDEVDDEERDASTNHNDIQHRQRGMTYAEIRQQPTRNSKDRSLLGTKRRTIMKPTKRTQLVHKECTSLKPSEIKRLYLNKKLNKFTPASLETIIEEDSADTDNEELNKKIRFLGTRKLRRAVRFNNGCFVSGAIKKKRREKIKKVLGKKPALKKISLEEFLVKLKNMEENQLTATTPDEMEVDYSQQKTATTTTANINIENPIMSSLTVAESGAMTDYKMEVKSDSM